MIKKARNTKEFLRQNSHLFKQQNLSKFRKTNKNQSQVKFLRQSHNLVEYVKGFNFHYSKFDYYDLTYETLFRKTLIVLKNLKVHLKLNEGLVLKCIIIRILRKIERFNEKNLLGRSFIENIINYLITRAYRFKKPYIFKIFFKNIGSILIFNKNKIQADRELKRWFVLFNINNTNSRINNDSPKIISFDKIVKERLTVLKNTGFLKIKYSKRNIFATLSDLRGNFRGITTTGLLKTGRGRTRNLIENIRKTASKTVNTVFKSSLTNLIVVQKGKTFRKKKKTFYRSVLRRIVKPKRIRILEITRPAIREHNGSRPAKIRRR